MAAIEREQLTYGEPCDTDIAVPLRVTARLAEGMVFRGSLMLDGLLASVVAHRHRLLPPLAGEPGAIIEIPIVKADGFHLCSDAQFAREFHGLRYKTRQAPWQQYARMGNDKIKRCDISVGANKSYRVPYEMTHVEDDEVVWWCLGDAERIRGLLAHVHYLGRHRGSGKGKLQLHSEPWSVVETNDAWDGFPVVGQDGKPLRPLPPDWPGLSDAVRRGIRTLTYPYWDLTREQLCAVPG